MENKCSKCKHFEVYYVKLYTRFEKINYGFCRRSGICETVKCSEVCDKFVVKKQGRTSKKLIKNCLTDLLNEISELRKVVEAERNESEELR